jgi:hypothetical protein
MVLNGGENVAKFTGFGRGIANPVSSEQWKMKRAGNFYRRAISKFLLAAKMPLQFDVNIFVSKNVDQLFDYAACSIYSTMLQRQRKRAIITARQADQSCGIFLKFIFKDCAFIFGGAQLHFCDQAAQVLIPRAGGN